MKSKESPLTQEKLKQLLDYCPETGIFKWRVYRCHKARKGDVAGCVDSNGYIVIKLLKQKHYAHRLAWLCVHGLWPEKDIDHVDHDRSNNRISNLREVTHQENHRNRAMHKNNKSGVIGVRWDPRLKRWHSEIKAGKGEKVSLGFFKDLEEAAESRRKAEIKYGFHENHGMKKAG